MTEIPVQERRQRVSVLLNQVDEEVRKAEYDKALELLRKVYSFDIKNVYARAYEERVLTLKMERERHAVMAEAQRKAEEQAEAEVKRQLKEFFRQQEIDERLKRERERKEQELEQQARKKSTEEVSSETARGLQVLEHDAVRRMAELERKLTAQIDSLVAVPAGSSQDIRRMQADYEAKLAEVRTQYEAAQNERQKIEAEMLLRIANERRKLNEEGVAQIETARKEATQQALEKERARNIEQYQTVLHLMTKMQLSLNVQQPILQAMQISMNISEEQHKEVERRVQIASYASALTEIWKNGKPSDEDTQQLSRLQSLFGISTDEHKGLLERVKLDLGISDEATMVLVVEDDLPIRKFAEMLLKKILVSTHAVEDAEQAVEFLKQKLPSVIICDINLGPGKMTGFGFLQRLNAGDFGEAAKSIPVVLMSSIVDDFFVKTAESLGARSFIPKPITREGLEQALHHAMHG